MSSEVLGRYINYANTHVNNANYSSTASNRKSPSPSTPASAAASPIHNYMSMLSTGSSIYGSAPSSIQTAVAQSLVKSSKKSNQQSPSSSSGGGGGNGGGAINLCTNNQTSYGEGLAGKLMAPSSSEQSSSLLQPSRKSSSSVRFSSFR